MLFMYRPDGAEVEALNVSVQDAEPEATEPALKDAVTDLLVVVADTLFIVQVNVPVLAVPPVERFKLIVFEPPPVRETVALLYEM